MTAPSVAGVEKIPTGIPGFDLISLGGLPKGRTTLVSGTSGSAKTVFASQFLAQGVAKGEAGVFVTFEEPPSDVRVNMAGLGHRIADWERERLWTFVDASPNPDEERVFAGAYDLGALLARIENAVRGVSAKRLVIDSAGSLYSQFSDATVIRGELFRIIQAVRTMGVTAVMTAERTEEYGEIARFGVEEFVSDNVVILRNALDEEKRRRTIEILKFRGAPHQKGEFPFSVLPGEGIIIIPLSSIELTQKSTTLRITSGCPELDAMCGGGFFRDSVMLVSGPTGTGKTLFTTEFLKAGAAGGEKCLLFAYEESREQLFRNAAGWGADYEAMEAKGLLEVICNYPEIMGLEDHLIHIKEAVDRFKPQRVAIDSLSALERGSSGKSFREFVIALTSFVKDRETAALYTSTTETLLGGSSITETHISTITDSIILLRYVELMGEMRRGLTILKMRGSTHQKDIREFHIDGSGMNIGKPFRNVTGIISGRPQHVRESEMSRIENLFHEG